MIQLLDSEIQIVLSSGFLYLPLLLDPSIEEELSHMSGPGMRRRPGAPRSLIEANGRYFIRALSLQSLVENYSKLHTVSYQQLRNVCLKEYTQLIDQHAAPLDPKLETILFQVMPHFIRRKGFKRSRPGAQEIIDMVAEEVGIPEVFYRQASGYLEGWKLEHPAECFESQETVEPLSGMVSGRQLREWVHSALMARALQEEKARLRALQEQRERLLDAGKRYVAVLLYLAQRGSFEKDRFGFHRIAKSNDYVVYKRVEEYALKDFYGNLYLFPPCRVAVSTIGYIKAFILDRYKHPFLKGYRENQEICLGHESEPRRFSAENVIAVLEEGINALFYGYNTRKRNGYHSLDTMVVYRHTIQFNDYRIPNNHPKILSGLVEVKNKFK